VTEYLLSQYANDWGEALGEAEDRPSLDRFNEEMLTKSSNRYGPFPSMSSKILRPVSDSSLKIAEGRVP
jgi:hypothetical protein